MFPILIVITDVSSLEPVLRDYTSQILAAIPHSVVLLGPRYMRFPQGEFGTKMKTCEKTTAVLKQWSGVAQTNSHLFWSVVRKYRISVNVVELRFTKAIKVEV